MNVVTDKLNGMGIKLAIAKSEILVMVGRQKLTNLSLNVEAVNIESKPEVKYMGIYLDKEVTLTTHVKNICQKSLTKLNIFSRLMPKLGDGAYFDEEY